MAMKEVASDVVLSKFGAREKVEFAYFSTIYALVEYRTSWGYENSHYLGRYGWETDPQKHLDRANEIHVAPGSSISLESEVVLVVRSRKHALLISRHSEIDCEPIRRGANLTLGALYKKKKSDLPGCCIYVTDEMPTPISDINGQCWTLVIGGNDQGRGWRRFNRELYITEEFLALHAFVNYPYFRWVEFE
jgi:hypothetical protein